MKLWTLLPTKLAHDLAPLGIKGLSHFMPDTPPEWKPLKWRGLHFPNRLGLAGGADKNGVCASAWPKLGAGFMELGTVTPLPQNPNPGSILQRDMQNQALWNKMGFPNAGLQSLVKNLKALKSRPIPIFINIGKNRSTPNKGAAQDYATCLRGVYDLCDGIVVNISSPNTKGLRDLQSDDYLKSFIDQILDSRPSLSKTSHKPVLIKFSPDENEQDFTRMIDLSYSCGVDGWVLTNTTTARAPHLNFPMEGGVSGAPLKDLSRQKLSLANSHLGERKKDKLLISVGGVMDEHDIRWRLANGADLVEVYSALIVKGPWFFRDMAKTMNSSEA